MIEPRSRNRRSPLRRLVKSTLRLTLLAVLVLGGTSLWVIGSTSSRCVEAAEAPERDWAIVLGASVLRSGRPSPMLDERLRTTAQLYHDRRVERILCSGDRDPDAGYDEVGPMRARLVELGVPFERITLDSFGFRTFDSMVRAGSAFGIDSALVVTNPFHVPRAVYIARQNGIDCVGIFADHGENYSTRTTLRSQGREALARVVALMDCHLLGTEPKRTQR